MKIQEAVALLQSVPTHTSIDILMPTLRPAIDVVLKALEEARQDRREQGKDYASDVEALLDRAEKAEARLHRLMQFSPVKGIADWLDSEEGQRIHPEGCTCGRPCEAIEGDRG